MAIFFFAEDISFKLAEKRKVKNWIKNSINFYGFKLGAISYIFCSEAFLLTINKQFLNHNFHTDIITFPFSEGNVISADIYISIDRVTENSKKFKVTFENELRRVIIHGVLHLLGFNDNTPKNKVKMREEENTWLTRF